MIEKRDYENLPLHVSLDISPKTYDIDFGGVVSNIVYVRWLEDLRLDLMAKYFPMQDQLLVGTGPVIASTKIDYLRPVRMFDQITAHLWVKEIGRRRVIMEAEFLVSGEITTRASQTGVFVSLETFKSIDLPSEFVEKFQKQLSIATK